MAFGRQPDRTILVQVGSIRPFSDIAGRHILRLDNTEKARHQFARRLETVDCDVDTSGDDWLEVGNFQPSEEIREQVVEQRKTVVEQPETIITEQALDRILSALKKQFATEDITLSECTPSENGKTFTAKYLVKRGLIRNLYRVEADLDGRIHTVTVVRW